jgi:long-chain acyl-CoA synthetase
MSSSAEQWYLSRPWTARYPDWMPRTLALDPDETGASMLDAACTRFAAQAAFVLGERTLSYAQWSIDADRLARWFVHRCGAKPGDRVLFLARNVPEFAVAMLAAWRARLVVVPLNPAYAAPEFAHPVEDAQPVAIVAEAALLPAFRSGCNGHALRELVIDHVRWSELLEEGAACSPVDRAPRPDDIALLQYTGGTTGVSKAVVTTHHNLIAQVQMMRTIFADRIRVGADVVLGAHPFFHSLAVSMNLMQFPSNGAVNVLFPNMKDFPALVAGMRARPVSMIVGGPALYYGLLGVAGFDTLDFSTLRACFVGGMPLRPDMQARWERVTGCAMTEGYGLTEVGGGCIVQLGDERRAGSVGFPCPSLELSVRDAEGAAVPPDAPGELWVRGPCLMPGYYRHPEETARAMTPDGWFKTGDIGRVDADGYVYLLDRSKDIIIISNSNVYPTEIEAVVGAHPGVADVCAVGIPDPDWGEAVRVVVVRRDPALDAAAISAWCAERLADFKCPRAIEFRDALPRSAVGKVLRRALR